MEIFDELELERELAKAQAAELYEKVKSAVQDFMSGRIKVGTKGKLKATGLKLVSFIKAAAAAVAGALAAAKAFLYTLAHPGFSELCALMLLGAGFIGLVSSFFCKALKRLRWLFAGLAALAAVFVVLRCVFRRDDD